jgi:hypothetical protein
LFLHIYCLLHKNRNAAYLPLPNRESTGVDILSYLPAQREMQFHVKNLKRCDIMRLFTMSHTAGPLVPVAQ